MSEELQSRLCRSCKGMKPHSAFWKDKRLSDGLHIWCKDCHNRHFRERRYPRLKTSDTYKEQHAVRQRRYVANHPEVVAAHSSAKRVARADKCERCGSTERLHKHHPDYSRPLSIVTLCNPCHEAEHHPREYR